MDDWQLDLFAIFVSFFPGSSLSNHSVTYSSRSASCQPTRLYQSEDIRTAAKLNRPPSKVYLCQEERDRARSAGPGRTKSPSRFDGTPVELPGFMKSNYYLHHEDLSMGQKQYIWGVARIYSVSQLMNLKQRQYQNLLDYEFSRRIQNKELKEHERVKEWKDYQRYCRFIKRYEQVILHDMHTVIRAHHHFLIRSCCLSSSILKNKTTLLRFSVIEIYINFQNKAVRFLVIGGIVTTNKQHNY